MYSVDDRYLRPKKAMWLRRMYSTPFPQRDDLAIWTGENATILPRRNICIAPFLGGMGGVVDKDGNFVDLSANTNRIGTAYPVENPLFRDEKVVFCGYMYPHWGHFLVESVTRLWYFLKQDPTVDKYIFFVNEGEDRAIRGNYRRFFELLGIWDKTEFINRPITFREVIVPEASYLCMNYWSQEYKDIFDAVSANVIPDAGWTPKEKIFFSRSQFAKNSQYEFGLDSLDHFFQKNGYSILAPERLSLDETIFYIRNARTVGSISGTLPHNMLFGQDGQELVVAERLVINVDHQVCVNQIRRLKAVHIDANYPIYTVDTQGPYIVGCNHLLLQYASENGLLPPDEHYTSPAYRDKCFKQYMHSYLDNYNYRWHKESWYPEIADSLWEAYEDSYATFREYLDREKPFLPLHWIQWHYIKQFIKRILKRLR